MNDLNVFQLGRALRAGELTAVELTRQCLDRAASSSHGAWRTLTPDRALRSAVRADRLFAEGRDPGPLLGIPVGIKDNIGMAGEISLAGLAAGLVTETQTVDSTAVTLLEEAGAVIIGRLHMTELAFTALGVSDQGTPVNPLDRVRVPGGSSSGSAVAVAAGEVPLAVGSDTGGSIRIPAAFTGLAGFKPTTSLADLRGVFPLSRSLDTIGPLARTAAEAELLLRVLLPGLTPQSLPRRLLIPETVLLDDLDARVAADFKAVTGALEAAGFTIERRPLPSLQEIRAARRLGSFAGWEACSCHGELLEQHESAIGVASEILNFRSRDPQDYRRLQETRASINERFAQETSGWDAILSPTVACLPPQLAEVRSMEDFKRLDGCVLRNTQLWNFLGLPTLAMPMGRLTSLSITVPAGRDLAAFAMAERLTELRP